MEMPRARPRFFVDAMLGNVARKLRLLGYDSRYDPGIDDADLIREAAGENRVIVTKDRELAGRCSRLGQEHVLVLGDGDVEQILQVRARLELGDLEITGESAICTRCNSPTEPLSRQDLSGVLLPKVARRHEKFWRCRACGSVYWKGTHIRDLQSFVVEANGHIP